MHSSIKLALFSRQTFCLALLVSLAECFNINTLPLLVPGSGSGTRSRVGPTCDPQLVQNDQRGQQPLESLWFPACKGDLDMCGTTLDAEVDLQADHPGFQDAEYRKRRARIAENSLGYRHGDALPTVDYTDSETETWTSVYKALRSISGKHAASSYNDIVGDLEREGLFSDKAIPQLGDISDYLEAKTGFTLRPVTGLMTPRHFLNGLAFKIFHSTQYVRHHSRPLYTPEPDVLHEFCGHVPMFADPAFAALSQSIGLASIGASDFEIKRLATAYWFSVEFGLCLERGDIKAYGAGLLSSIGEMQYACGLGGARGIPEYRDFDPAAASLHDYPITDYQPLYYVASSLEDAEAQIGSFCNSLTGRSFSVGYDEESQTIVTSRPVKRREFN